jgi:hypothetical protein
MEDLEKIHERRFEKDLLTDLERETPKDLVSEKDSPKDTASEKVLVLPRFNDVRTVLSALA